MQYPSWQSSRERLGKYSHRLPWESALYQLVYNYREEFEYRWDELFFEKYGHLRAEVLEAFDRFLNCGVLRHGCARAHCEKCNHSILIAFSCKRRNICPSCSAKRALLFAERLQNEVLKPFPHRLLTSTIPKRLRIYFRFDRELLGDLSRALWESWKEYVQHRLGDEVKPGAVIGLHTAGDLGNFNPHCHSVALAGAMKDGEFVELEEIDTDELSERFRKKVFSFLLEKGLISEETIESMNAWQHSGFSMHIGEPVAADDQDARLFQARYLVKNSLSLKRLEVDHSGIVPQVRLKKVLDDGEQIRELSPLEFLAELSLQVPKIFEQTTKYFGCYSHRTRGAERRDAEFKAYLEQRRLGNGPEKVAQQSVSQRPASASWARCIKQVFEVDPLKCPKCGHQMKIVAFIQDTAKIEKIAENLGYVTWRAPPAIGNTTTTQRFVSIDTQYVQ